MTTTGDAHVLTEAEREALGLIVNRYDHEDQSLADWHPCRECPNVAKNEPCPCSGRAWLGDEMTTAVEAILAAHTADLRAELDQTRAKVAAVEALHQPVPDPEERPGVLWCSCAGGEYERPFYEYNDCPTRAALAATPQATMEAAT